MPGNIVKFEMLMYVSLMLQIVTAVTNDSAFTPEHRALTMGALLFSIALTVFITWLIARRGVNWARWLLAILFVLSAPFLLLALAMGFSMDPVGCVLNAVQMSLQAIALVLVFSGDARDWFGSGSTA
jgi:hypothetical protein